MKKKLKIEQLKVQSFVTQPDINRFGGGETVLTCPADTTTDNLQTAFSCLHYISCNPLDCVVNSYSPNCPQVNLTAVSNVVCP